MLISFILLSIVLSYKIINIFNFNLNIGIVPYMMIFSVIYIILTKFNENEKKPIFRISLITSLFVVVSILLSCFYIHLVEDNVATNINTLFLNNYKILILYPIVLLFEEIIYFDLYNKLQKKYESVFVTNIIICLILSILSTFVTTSLTYINILNYNEIIDLTLTNYLFKIFITLSTIPLMFNITKKVER
jgi:uncharacterized PurR-regulated membrane protein YhhQ (DUF165 family)